MRLKLQIFRNELPVVKLIWETTTRLKPGTDHIVSNLLASIDEVFPLEGSTWGLEDYVVELDGYEVLHFQELSTVFKDDDTVVIRPLSTSEVRHRRVSGRQQITTGGRKLLDGTPFGRPYIRRAADRPQLLIPSAKRSKSNEGIETSTLQLLGAGEDEDGDDDDYEPVDSEVADEDDNMDSEEAAAEIEAGDRTVVRFVPVAPIVTDGDDGSGDDSDDSSFKESSSESDSEDSESEVDSNASSEDGGVSIVTTTAGPVSKEGVGNRLRVEPPTKKPKPSSPDSSKSSSSGELEGNKGSSGDETPEVKSSKRKGTKDPDQAPAAKGPGTAPGTLPHRASAATKARNARKRDIRLLKRLQAQGVVESGSTLSGLKTLLAQNGLNTTSPLDTIKSYLENHRTAQDVGQQIDEIKNQTEGGELATISEAAIDKADEVTPLVEKEIRESKGNEITVNETPVKEVPVKKRDRKAYKAAIQAGLAQPGDIKKWLRDQNACHNSSLPEDSPSALSTENDPARVILEPKTRKIKVTRFRDLEPSPFDKKNKKWKRPSHKFALRTIYDEYGNSVTVDAAPEEEELPEGSDPDAWRSKIYLSAVECEQNNVQLPTPDFPFKQQQLQQNDGAMNPGKKRKRSKKHHGTNMDEYEEHHELEAANPSVFDDLLGRIAVNGEKVPTEEDLPMLPIDMSSLAPLTQPLLRGTIIAFKQLSIGERYMPVITDYRTAMVEKVYTDVPDGPLVQVRLAIRDRPQAQYDEETGEKILGKFDMPGFEKTEETGFLELMFGELLEAKVVKLPEGGVEPEEPEHLGTHDDHHDGDHNPGELDYGDDIHMGDSSNNPPANEAPDASTEQNGREAAMDKAPAPTEELEPESMDSHTQQGNKGNDPMQVWEEETFCAVEMKDGAQEEMGDSAQEEMEEPPRTSSTVRGLPIAENGVQPGEKEAAIIPPASSQPTVERDASPLVPTEATKPKGSKKPKSNKPDQTKELSPIQAPSPTHLPSPIPAPELESPLPEEEPAKPRSKFDWPTDSEGELPSLETFFSQKASQVKAEPKDDEESPSLPPLPDFSPFSVRDQSVDLSQRQIQAEATATTTTATTMATTKYGGKNAAVKRRSSKPIEVIDLVSSSPERAPPPPPRIRGASKSNASTWKAVRGLGR
ncbi:hypothetical protein K440DRAFT_658415 [Wilcoxina mikolae CBS 423.85]|nr:hypothetical protein K440DRAFT_658415 [Wilcoxina mikolae CBS 423.85]